MRNAKVIDMLRVEYAAEVARLHEQIAELNDRLQARSLAELRAFRPVAMPAAEPDELGHYESDPTGLVRVWVPDDASIPDRER